MKSVKFLIKDRTSFHLGDANQECKEIFSSDQLFSALINCVALLYDDNIVENVIDQFNNNQINISSMFFGLDFCFDNEVKSIYLLPKPNWLIKTIDVKNQVSKFNESNYYSKKFRKVKYFSLGVYKALLTSWTEQDQDRFFSLDLTNYPMIGTEIIITKEEMEYLEFTEREEAVLERLTFFDKQTKPKVAVDRFSGGSLNHFYQNQIITTYQKVDLCTIKPFMYFWYRGELAKELKAATSLLADEGIGGKRSRGMGHFSRVEFNTLPHDDFSTLRDTSSYYINLSTLFPKVEEVANIISYKLSNRSGYIGDSSYRRKTVRVIAEGSICNSFIEGRIIEVTPDELEKKNHHKVLLNGKSFLIGFGGDGNEIRY